MLVYSRPITRSLTVLVHAAFGVLPVAVVAGLAGAAIVSVSGCVSASGVECNGMVCAESTVCVSATRGCVPAEQVTACDDRAEGAMCTISSGDGLCIGGVCEQSRCGDGVVDEVEVCDDGNSFGGDSCSADCQTASCLVPSSHATLQELVNDETCSTAFISSGTYTESVVVGRDVEIVRVGVDPVVLMPEVGSAGIEVLDGSTVRLVNFEIAGADALGCGGGIRNRGDLFLEGMTIRDNKAARGAGICHEAGTLFVLGGRVANNRVQTSGAYVEGAGLYADAVVLVSGGAVFENNLVTSTNGSARGAAFFISGAAATFTGGCVFRGNRVEATIANPFNRAFGGAGYTTNNAALSIIDGRFETNSSASPGSTSNGGALLIDNGSFSINSGSVFMSNTAYGDEGGGGAIAIARSNGTISQSRFEDNEANGESGADGGAIFLFQSDSGEGGVMRLEEVTVTNNRSVSATDVARGGGVAVRGRNRQVTIEQSSITGNSVSSANAVGGGFSYEGAFSVATVVIESTTFAGNTSSGRGGGVFLSNQQGVLDALLFNTTISGNEGADLAGVGVESVSPMQPSRLAMFNVSIVENTAVGDTGGLGIAVAGAQPLNVTMSHSLIAGNQGDCATIGGVSFLGPVSNVFGRESCGLVDPDNPDPGDNNGNGVTSFVQLLLGPLADNGGPTETRLPGAASPLIDRGRVLGCQVEGLALSTDQRGVARVPPCDIGAVEVVP